MEWEEVTFCQPDGIVY